MILLLALIACVGDAPTPAPTPAAPEETAAPDTEPVDTEPVDTEPTETSAPEPEISTEVTWELDPPINAAGCPAHTYEVTQRFDQSALLGDGELLAPPVYGQGPGVSLGDLDGDGFLDALFTPRDGRSVGLRNDGAGGFVDDGVLSVDGGPIPAGTSSIMADLDGDGDLDVVLTRAAGLTDLLLVNDGTGRMSAIDLPSSTGEHVSPSLGDVDGDGDLDLFIPAFIPAEEPFSTVLAGERRGDGSDLLIQEAPGVFVNATERIPEEVRDAATFTGLFFDHDGDADLDLYLSNDFGPFIMPNQLLINEGGAFRQMLDSDPDYCWCLPTMQGMGAQIGDVDDDGDFDLHLTNIGQTYLYLALGDGTYADGAVVAGLEPTTRVSKTSWGAKFLDADLDGDEDLLVVMGSHDPANPNIAPAQPDVYFANTGAGKFVDHSLGSGFDDDGIGRGLATGDLDRDGLPDVVVATQLGVIVLRSEGGCTPGVTLTIDAGPGNRQGYQALVRFTMPDGSERLRMMSPATTFGASAAELYLPAPYASTVPRIEVEVPGRAPVVYEHVPIGTRLHVTL